MGSKQSQVKLVLGAIMDKSSILQIAKQIYQKNDNDFALEYDIHLKQSKTYKKLLIEILFLLSNCDDLIDKAYQKLLIYPDLNFAGKCLLKLKTDNLTQKQGKKQKQFYKITMEGKYFYYENCAMSGKRLSIDKTNLNYESYPLFLENLEQNVVLT